MRFLKLLPPAWLLLPLVLLTACGDKRELLAPSPLPDFAPAVEIDRIWSANIGAGSPADGLRLLPALTGTAVYAADAEGLVIARERTSGRVLWKRKTAEPISAGPVVAYNQLFFGTREGALLVLSADDGSTLWTAALGGEVLAPPAVEGDAVVVRSTDGRTTLFDRTSGAMRWVHDGGNPALALRAASKPILLTDAVLVGLASGMLVMLDRVTGQVIWERRIAEPAGKSELDRLIDIAGDFVLVGDRIYAATYQGRIVALDLRSGQFVWQQPVSTFQSLAAAAGNVYVVDADGRVVAYRGADGVVLWRLESLLGRQLTGVAVLGDWLLVGDFEGYLHLIRQADGVIVGRRRIDRDGIVAAPVVDEDTVFVLGRGGKLAALKIEARDR